MTDNNIQKKYRCDVCLYYTNYASEWNKHTTSMKHQRNGQPKENKKDNYVCNECEYKGNTIWNLKMHKTTQHSTKEEREKQKYYCKDCDKVFFCSTYFNKHNNGIVHKNKVIANQTIKNPVLI